MILKLLNWRQFKMALFGLVFVTIGIWGTYNIIKYIED
ncbi:hypothetical protein AVT93_gp50 [Enterococcus phage vB_EfaS_IME196]|uniref:Uncharacterized protein n=1 Tax=Enterococcus phage vB_EfaS_IME196 TaxID=1747289 RepID=A0A0S2MY78_9CAUD|nr:hypothetical protein AVT93_gp50 [Enterococcus phage vB_EfaS_IME196]ALO80918.1 hypothetical protein [Enterococcus phage vB_EfaS_IME196]